MRFGQKSTVLLNHNHQANNGRIFDTGQKLDFEIFETANHFLTWYQNSDIMILGFALIAVGKNFTEKKSLDKNC